MKIRLQIAAWMVGVGCFSIMIFLGFVFSELQEAYLELIQAETEYLARQVAYELNQTKHPDRLQAIQQLTSQDWVRIETEQGQAVFVSAEARQMPLELPERGESETHSNAHILAYPAGNWTIYVAKKTDNIQDETQEMQLAMAAGLIFALLFLGGSSYWVAARILRPVREINQLAQDISAQHLDQRIPLSRSQDELYELSQALNQMFDRIEESMKQQRQFLSDASHELKTPTAMLRLFLEQLSHSPDLSEELLLRLDSQMEGLLRMERLIKQLLELSVFESREQLSLENTDLSALIQTLLEEFSPLLELHQIQLTLDLPAELRLKAHSDYLRRMLICLLENAVLYNQPDGQLIIQAKQTPTEIQLDIQNTGQPIPVADLPHLFERFYRVDKSRSQVNGSGLGLSIVQQIMRLHHGTVSISSNQLTCVRLVFPAA